MSHSLVTICVFLILGILLGQRLPHNPILLWILLATTLAAGFAGRNSNHRPVSQALFIALIVVAGALRSQLASPLVDPSHFLTQNLFGSGRYEVEVVSDPTVSENVLKAAVTLKRVWMAERSVVATGRVRLVTRIADPTAPTIAYGDVLDVTGSLAPPRDGYAGPGTALGELWANEGLFGVLTPQAPPKQLAKDSGNPVSALLYRFRHHMSDLLDQTHPPEVAAFVRTILLGIREMPAGQVEDFRTTGTYHLLAIAGCHVGILAVVLASIFSLFRLPARPAGFAVCAILACYAVLAGETVSVTRAVIMAIIFILGQLAYRPVSIYTSLAAAAILLLAVHPLSVFLPGFQLSFLAVLSVAYLTPVLMARLDFLPPYLNALISTSLATSLGTAPVLAMTFGTFPLLSPIANLVAIPLFGVILPIGILALLGSCLSPWVPFFFGAANYGFVTLLSGIIHQLAQIPHATLDVTDVPPTLWIVYSLGLVVLGDYHNLRETLRQRLKMGEAQKESPAPEEIDQEILARTARELACLLPDDQDALDPISRRLASVRGVIRAQTQELAPEFLLRCEALLSEPWAAPLDPLTLAYLGLSESVFLAGRSPDKSPALLLLLKALEHELNVHFFGALRLSSGQNRAVTLTGRYPKHPLINFLASPPHNLSLEAQNEVLWAMISNQERPLKGVVRAIQRGLASTLADPNYFLDPSQFPLRLDQIYKRFYLRLDKEPWDWEGVRRAREEILGPKQENLFEQLGRTLGAEGIKTQQLARVGGADVVQHPDSAHPVQSLDDLACAPGSESP
jgi:ComEC/Rec2-related protein